MAEKKLGKGLGALFGNIVLDDELTPINEHHTENETNETVETENDGVQQIAVAMIDNNINQPRKVFNQEALRELAESIKTYSFVGSELWLNGVNYVEPDMTAIADIVNKMQHGEPQPEAVPEADGITDAVQNQ